MIKALPAIACRLGEGLSWDPAAGQLWMTDIVERRLLRVDLDGGDHRAWSMPESIGWVLPTRSPGRYAVGLRSGIAVVDTRGDASPRWVERDFPGDPRLRLNDACTDRAGRIWYASMAESADARTCACLASFCASRGTTIHDTGFGVANGPVIAPDDRYLYVNDTLRGMVWRYDFDLTSGSTGARSVFARFEPADGFPDGMCFDVDGRLWLAMWGGGRVLRLDPNGRVERRIDLPAPNVTNVCFCGPSLDRLIVSSASIDMSADELARHPHAGRLFEILDHGTRGFASAPSDLA